VQSVQKAWLEISGSQRDFKGRLKQRLNLFHPLILTMEQRYYGGRKYRKLIALSDQVKDDLMRFYAVPDKDIVVIPNGFAPSEFNVARRNEQREAMRQKLGYANSDKVVIFAANELERKGFGPLLRAIAALDDSSVRLLAVGRLNPLAYASEIQRLGMTQRVKFTGPTSDVASYYAAADVFALPTQYEAWGLVIVEAMACGLPALTSRLAGASIAVCEGQTGHLLDDPADVAEIRAKLSLLLQGEHAAPEVVSDSVAQYAWSRVLETYEQVLMECARA
jgi:UDP-glucose:(heptosyl)LPS alpha-1,3-glucosyltransferase